MAHTKEPHCVVCGRPLPANRSHVDTCRERCYQTLLARQRIENARAEGDAVTLRAFGVRKP